MRIHWFVERFVLRRLLHEWQRAALLIPAIALGVAISMAILSAAEQSIASFEEAISIVRDDSVIEVRARTGVLTEAEILKWDTKIVRHLIPVVHESGRVNGSEEIVIFGLDPLAFPSSADARPLVSDGGDLMVSRRFARDVGLSPGDTVSLRIGEMQANAVIGGILDDRGSLKSSLPFAVMHVGALQHLLHREGVLDALWIASVDQEIETMLREYFAREHPALAVSSKKDRRDEGAKLLGAFQTNIGILVLISLGVCVLTIYNSSSLSMTLIRDEVAILRTLGASTPFCVAVFICEPLFLGTIGAGLGVTVGAPGIHFVTGIILETVTTLYRENGAVTFPTESSLSAWWPFVLGISVAVVGSMLPVISVSRVRPFLVRPRSVNTHFSGDSLLIRGALVLFIATLLLTYFAFTLGQILLGYAASLTAIILMCLMGPLVLELFSRASKSFVVKLWRVAGLVASGNLTYSAGSHGVSSATSAIGVAVLISLGVMISSFRETLGQWIERTIVADLYVRSDDGIPRTIADSIETISGVDALYRYSTVTLTDDVGPYVLAGASLEIARQRGNIPLLRGDFPRMADEALVSEAFARKRGCDLGSRILVQGVSFTVVGVSQDFSAEQGIVFLELGIAESLSKRTTLTSLSVFLDPLSDLQSIKREIEVILKQPELKVQDNKSLRSLIISIFDETFRVTGVLRLIVALICAGSVILAFRQLLWERRALLRTLFMLGGGDRTTRTALLIEAAVIAINAAGLGVVFGLGLAGILVYIINPLGFGWTLAFVPRLSDIVYPVFFVVMSCLLGAWLSVGRVGQSFRSREISSE